MRRWADQRIQVQMCVTSPPYFGLRDYGHEGQIGLEQRAPQYVAGLVDVFQCVSEVLSDDGVLFVAARPERHDAAAGRSADRATRIARSAVLQRRHAPGRVRAAQLRTRAGRLTAFLLHPPFVIPARPSGGVCHPIGGFARFFPRRNG